MEASREGRFLRHYGKFRKASLLVAVNYLCYNV